MVKDNSNSSFVAAIVIGSSKITGLVGHKEPEGNINVLAFTAVPSTDFVSKGRVFNVDKMTNCIKTIRDRLEEQTNCTVKKFYVALDCMGIRSVNKVAEKIFPQRVTIEPELIDAMHVANREENTSDHVILEIIPLEYKLGTITTTEPIGVMTDSIKAQFLNIICGATAIDTIENCFRKAGTPIVRHTIAATQMANVFTTEQERTSGCVFIDMGSETTTVAIYKGKLLRHLAVIPLGGANVTRDIANVFNCEENEAENLKRTYGFPNFESFEENANEMIHLRDGGRARPQSELAEIIDARIEEIVQNIKAQVEYSGFDRETLVNGLYITGGASQLPNISKAFDQHFKGWTVRFVKSPARLSASCPSDRLFNENGIYNVALSVVENGEVDCCGGPRVSHDPQLPFNEDNEMSYDSQDPENSRQGENTDNDDEALDSDHKKKGNGFGGFMSQIKKILTGLVTDED